MKPSLKYPVLVLALILGAAISFGLMSCGKTETAGAGAPAVQTETSSTAAMGDLTEATRLYEAKDNEAALKICEGIVAKNPKDTEALILESKVYSSLKKYAEAENALQSIVKLDPMNSLAYRFLGELMETQGKMMESRKYLNEGLKASNGTDPWTLLRLAQLSEKEGKNKEALEYMDKAVAMKNIPAFFQDEYTRIKAKARK